jgi:uncharacterized lipoprotein YmbA
MMIQTRRAITALLLLGLLAGCGSSPPVNYYVLSAHTGPAPAGSTPSLGVGPVAVPEYLNRDNMVMNREGNTLVVASSDRWAEPLMDGIQRVLAINLAGLLNTQSIRLHPWHRDQAPDYGVSINLLSLDASEQGATLAAEWLLYRPSDKQVVSRRLSRLEQPFPDRPVASEQVAAAYSELLLRLSEVIAGAIRSDNNGDESR